MNCMKIIRYIYAIIMLLAAVEAKPGDPICWLTYGHSKFVASPGIEASYLFKSYLGMHLGVDMYIQNPDLIRVSSIIHESKINFYSANLGLSGQVLNAADHKVGLIGGMKMYYGPDYHKLIYYEEGGYDIYFDAATLKPKYGLDIGIYYVYKKISLLAKYDFAWNRLRVGLGYRFR